MRARMEEACQSITAREIAGWQGAAFGTATCPEDGSSAGALISAADNRLLERKRA